MSNIIFEMNYTLKEIENITDNIKQGNNNFDYNRFGDLASVYDKEFGSSIYLGGYVEDKKLSITWSKHFGNWNDNNYENEYCNLVDWEEINSVGKLKKYMIKMLKHYNSLWEKREKVK